MQAESVIFSMAIMLARGMGVPQGYNGNDATHTPPLPESVMAITSRFKFKAIVDRASMHISRRDSEHKGSSDSVAKCKIVPKAGGLALAWFDRTALRWTIQQQGGSATMAVTVVMELDAPDAAKLLLSNVHGDLAALWHDEEGIHLTSLAPNSHSWSPPRLLISNPFELDKRGKRQNSVEYYLVAAELDRSGRRVHVVWKASQGNELSVGSVSSAAN